MALGTLSAIGAAALFPWYLAVAIAVLVTGMASACAFQFRETRNYLYLIAMFAMTGLAAFLDGVSVWELLNKRQNTELRGVQAQETVTQDQLEGAEARALAVRDEIASLTAEAQNMDNDGRSDNDRLIPGVLAKIESKKADLANFEAKVNELQAEARTAATTSAVSDAGRHVLLQLADRHPNPAQWLILWAGLIFCLPELTLALLAWSLRGSRRGQVRPQPVVIVPSGAENAHVWQALTQGGAYPMPQMPQMPQVQMAQMPQVQMAQMPQMALAYPQPVLRDSSPPPQTFQRPAAPRAAAMDRAEEQPAAPHEFPLDPPPASNVPLGMGQMMMAASHSPEASLPQEVPSSAPVESSPAIPARPETVVGRQVEPREAEAQSHEEDVMLSPDSVPDLEYAGQERSERSKSPETTAPKTELVAGRDRPGEMRSAGAQPKRTSEQEQPPSVLEAAANRNHQAHPQRSTPTKIAKNVAAKRSKKGGMRSRGTSLAELASASRLN